MYPKASLVTNELLSFERNSLVKNIVSFALQWSGCAQLGKLHTSVRLTSLIFEFNVVQ
jgi:hypothetical protein